MSFNLVAAEVKILETRQQGQVGPQRFGTIGADVVVAQVKMLHSSVTNKPACFLSLVTNPLRSIPKT